MSHLTAVRANPGSDFINQKIWPRVWEDGRGNMQLDWGYNGRVTLDSVRDGRSKRLKISAEAKPLLIHAEHILGVEIEAQKFAVSDDVSRTTLAMAIVVESDRSRDLARSFIQSQSPKYPVRIFRDEAAAATWLASYRFQAGETPAC